MGLPEKGKTPKSPESYYWVDGCGVGFNKPGRVSLGGGCTYAANIVPDFFLERVIGQKNNLLKIVFY